ncbi:MAG: PorP/SprF family type IX secretion system membrane protein [Bacteroidota bacterium]
MKKKLLFAVLVSAACMQCADVYAQDPHFSQYFNSPMTINPALTGKDIADWRVLANFRSQWWGGSETAPFTTTAISLEKAYQKGAGGKSSLGIGLSLLSDASNSGLLKNNFFAFGTAYNLALDRNGDEQIGLGLEAVYANRLVDGNKLELQSQFGSMGFQRSIPSGDPINTISNHYFDMNVGVYYSKYYPSNNWGFRAGAAIFHVSTPEEGVYNSNTYNINMRYSFQAGLVFKSTNGNELNVSAVNDRQGSNNIFSLGGVYKIKLMDNAMQSFNIGAWNRFNDSFYPYIGLEGQNWLVGLAYDIVNEKRNLALNGVQSIEFSLAWHFNSPRKAGAQSANVVIY